MAGGRTTSVFYSENVLRYYVVPPIFLCFFTSIVQYLLILGRGEEFDKSAIVGYLIGNKPAWNWLAFICLWAYTSLRIPGPTVLGPETPFSARPVYQDNGFLYYIITFGVFIIAQLFFPWLSPSLYDNLPYLVGSFSNVALVLCLFLWIKGRYYPEFRNDKMKRQPMLYEYYRGIELHPRVLGVDVKQLTNCRIGLMLWQVLIYAFFITGLQRNGFTTAACTDVLLQSVYIAKFFWWEAGYFYTLDMMLDRAGYYLCWGCLVWVPTLYTYSSYNLVAFPNYMSPLVAGIILGVGLISIFLNYRVDFEKQLFRSSPNYKCDLWGKPANYISAEYTDGKGQKRKSALLISGFWGTGRHINYTFELLSAFSWCAASGLFNSILPFFYFIFLFCLLIHRTLRDEDKCSKKYGKYWDTYCKKVPYRLIPYIW